MNEQLKDRIKRISIRGRFAIALRILEIELPKYPVFEQSPTSKTLISRLKEFTNSTTVDDWMEETNRITPATVLEDGGRYDAEYFADFLKEEDFNEFHKQYKALPERFLSAIDYTTWLGQAHIYVGVPSYSEETYEYLLDVIELTTVDNLPEIIARYEFSSFEQRHGWGNRFNYDEV